MVKLDSISQNLEDVMQKSTKNMVDFTKFFKEQFIDQVGTSNLIPEEKLAKLKLALVGDTIAGIELNGCSFIIKTGTGIELEVCGIPDAGR